VLKLDVALWLLAALVPGAALIRILWPDAGLLRTIACAPPVSFGFSYAVGLAASRLSLSPIPAVLVATAVLIVCTVAVDVWRRRAAPTPSSADQSTAATGRVKLAERAPAQLVSWAMLAAAMVLGVLLWRSFQSNMLVPVGWDGMHHGYFIEQISRFHTMKSSVVLSSDTKTQDGGATFYPLAFNLVAAVLHVSTGGAISKIMLASTVALAGVLLPLGSFALAQELDARQPLVAGFAAITPVLPVILYLIEGTGRLTGILGIALVPGLVVLLLSQRTAARWSILPLAVLGVIGIIGMHTSEAPLAILTAAFCVLVPLARGEARGGMQRWFGWVIAAGALGVVALAVLEPDLLHLATARNSDMVPAVDRPSGQVVKAGLSALGGSAWVLPIIGVAATLLPRWRRFRGTAAMLAFFALLYYFQATGVKTLAPTLATPWYDDSGRITWDLTIVGAIPAAVGLAAITGLVGNAGAALARFVMGTDRAGSHRVRNIRIEQWAAPLLAAFVGAVIVVGFALPPVGRQGLLASQVVQPVDQDSVAAFNYLKAHVGPDEQVLDDLRSDGAMWMYIDHGVAPLFGSAPLTGHAPHSWLEKLYLKANLMKIADPCVRSLVNQYNVHYVYVGDRRIFDGWEDYQSASMRRNPAFTEVFHQGHAHVFVVNHAEPSRPCTRNVTANVHWG
jgi:hypothetical protein